MRLAFALNRKCEFKLEKVEMTKPAHIIWKDIKLRRMINDVEILYNFQSIYVKLRINSVSYDSAEFQNVESFKIHSLLKQRFLTLWKQGTSADISMGLLGKVWWKVPCFHKVHSRVELVDERETKRCRLVYDRNHYFGLDPISKQKLADTFGRYGNQNRNHILYGEYG